jgi:hypothetical protein
MLDVSGFNSLFFAIRKLSSRADSFLSFKNIQLENRIPLLEHLDFQQKEMLNDTNQQNSPMSHLSTLYILRCHQLSQHYHLIGRISFGKKVIGVKLPQPVHDVLEKMSPQDKAAWLRRVIVKAALQEFKIDL